jgi:hypothetical protein
MTATEWSCNYVASRNESQANFFQSHAKSRDYCPPRLLTTNRWKQENTSLVQNSSPVSQVTQNHIEIHLFTRNQEEEEPHLGSNNSTRLRYYFSLLLPSYLNRWLLFKHTHASDSQHCLPSRKTLSTEEN